MYDFKLVSVPELGYTTEDKPYPRGELRVKTKRLITGYYKQPKVIISSYLQQNICSQSSFPTKCCCLLALIAVSHALM